jgi:hypothetical protein
MNVALAVTGIAHLLGVLYVPPSSPAILIGHLGHRALVQVGPPLVFLAGVLSVCIWHWSLVYAAPTSAIFVLKLKSGDVVTRVAPRRSRSLIGLQRTW